MVSTSRDVQCIEGCSVHRRMFSTSGEYHEYIKGVSCVHRGCSVRWKGTMMHVGDIMSTFGDVQYIGVFNINQKLLSICSPT